MSIIFSKKGRKAIQFIFGFVAILVTISMIALYAPGIALLFQ